MELKKNDEIKKKKKKKKEKVSICKTWPK